jgi:hypothetical protein
MRKSIYLVTGAKGGTGKSMWSGALLDYLLLKGSTPALAEADTTNPDVMKSYLEEVPSDAFDLDLADGWISMVNFVDERKDNEIVINAPARNEAGFRKFRGHSPGKPCGVRAPACGVLGYQPAA